MFGDNKLDNKSTKNAIMGLMQQYKERKLTTDHVRKLNSTYIHTYIHTYLSMNSVRSARNLNYAQTV